MASPLEGLISQEIYAGMKDIFIAGTLMRDIPMTSSPDFDEFDPPPPSGQSQYPCKIVVELYSKYIQSLGTVQQNDRKILILALSLATTPEINDRILTAGQEYTVLNVEIDPANAVWILQARA